MPLAGSLLVLRLTSMPGRDLTCVQKQKSLTWKPMSLVATCHLKKTSHHFHFVVQKWREQSVLKKIGGKCLVTSGGNWSLKKSKFEKLELLKKFNNSKFCKTHTDHTSLLAHPLPMFGPTTLMSPLPHFRWLLESTGVELNPPPIVSAHQSLTLWCSAGLIPQWQQFSTLPWLR